MSSAAYGLLNSTKSATLGCTLASLSLTRTSLYALPFYSFVRETLCGEAKGGLPFGSKTRPCTARSPPRWPFLRQHCRLREEVDCLQGIISMVVGAGAEENLLEVLISLSLPILCFNTGDSLSKSLRFDPMF